MSGALAATMRPRGAGRSRVVSDEDQSGCSRAPGAGHQRVVVHRFPVAVWAGVGTNGRGVFQARVDDGQIQEDLHYLQREPIALRRPGFDHAPVESGICCACRRVIGATFLFVLVVSRPRRAAAGLVDDSPVMHEPGAFAAIQVERGSARGQVFARRRPGGRTNSRRNGGTTASLCPAVLGANRSDCFGGASPPTAHGRAAPCARLLTVPSFVRSPLRLVFFSSFPRR